VSVDTAGLWRLLDADSGIANVAYRVSDTTRVDVRLQAFYARPIVSEDTVVLARLGAVLFHWVPRQQNLSFTAPDSAVTQIAAVPGIAVVRAQAMACVIAN
jgi:hypothetical protein